MPKNSQILPEPSTEPDEHEKEPEQPEADEEHEEQPETAEDGRTEPETFTREYVEQLRAEAAEGRIKSKRATDLETALREAVISKVAGSILQDPSSLEWSDNLADEDGMPSPDLIREAAEALAAAKPHLSRVSGPVLQGHRGEDSDAGTVDLAGLLRAGA
ncbi:hypothetical protein [Aeromicrobium sp.]|uniref:hypothetical protein n=1 Tax=Aeromicrobium sp. TaxID=1871063 RepID=UPI0030C54742